MFAEGRDRMAPCDPFRAPEPRTMKSIRNLLTATLLTAGALLTAATGMSAANAADEAANAAAEAAGAPPPGAAPGWHHHRGPWHLLSKLDLNAAQKQQIK